MSKRTTTIISILLIVLSVLLKTIFPHPEGEPALNSIDFIAGVLFGSGISFYIQTFIRRLGN